MLIRSPVFRAMLKAGMKEQASGRIELKSMKLKTGRDLLYYLYNRQLREDANVVGLLGLADQYDMQAVLHILLSGLMSRSGSPLL
jgi:BTB/POZ domain